MRTREAEASNYRLWQISTFCVFFARVSGWKGKLSRESDFEQQCQMSRSCLRESRIQGSDLILRSDRFLMSARPSKRIAGTCCHCPLQALPGLQRTFLDQDDTCALERTCFVASLLIYPSHYSNYGPVLLRPPVQQLLALCRFAWN